jgi:hypothetical protein
VAAPGVCGPGPAPGAGRSEADKCTRVCDHYAAHAESFLAPEDVATDPHRAHVAYGPGAAVFTRDRGERIGRGQGAFGIREFVNVKTVCVA